MLKRIKHWLCGHEFYCAWSTTNFYNRQIIAFVCKCGATKQVELPGAWTPSSPHNPATDTELEQLKKMAGLK